MKFSIITVVKNDEKNVLKTLASVKNQNYQNYEHIVIDGKSTDRTFYYIKNFKNKKIRSISKRDKNLYQALNTGIKMSKGKYIGILHSGDKFFSKSTLNQISKNIKNYDFLFGNVVFKKKNKFGRRWKYKFDKVNKKNAFKIAHTSLFLRKKILIRLKLYDENYRISSDTDLILRLCNLKDLKFNYLNKFVIIMSQNGLSTSLGSTLFKIREDLVIYYKHFRYMFLFNYLYKIIYKLFKLYI